MFCISCIQFVHVLSREVFLFLKCLSVECETDHFSGFAYISYNIFDFEVNAITTPVSIISHLLFVKEQF